MRTFKVLTLSLFMSTALIHPAQAEPITAALFGTAFASTFFGSIVSIGIGSLVTYGLSALFGAIFPQSATGSDTTGNRTTEVQYGERVSRSGIFGTVLTGGHNVHMNEYDNAKKLQYVAVLGDGWHDSLAGIYINGRQYDLLNVTAGADNEHKRYTVDTFGSLIDVRFHDGRPGQLADTTLVAQSSGWTSAKKFSNQAYVVVTVTSNKEKFNGIPDIKFIVKGLRCYDPRKDTTAGGSGSHRFADPTTWEYTDNPAVQAYHYARGFYFNGVRSLGIGLDPSELNLDTFITAMNVCDETAEDPNGVDYDRYTCHTAFNDTDQFANVMQILCDAMGGSYADMQGEIAIFAGKAQSVVAALTESMLVADEDLVFNPGRPGETLVTGIQGTYMHSSDYTPTPYTAIEPPEFVSANWYPNTIDVNFDQVRHPHQAYLLAKQKLFANRLQASLTATFDIQKLIVQINDWVTFAGSGPMTLRTYKVTGCSYNLKQMRMTLSLAETSVDVYDDDATPDDVAEPVRTRPLTGYITTVSNLDITPIMLVGGNGEELPALEFTYDGIVDPGVTAVEIFYRVQQIETEGHPDYVAAGPIFKVTDSTPDDGVIRATSGVTPGRIHEAYARLISIPGREVTDSAWVSAEFPTGDMTVVAEAYVSDLSITIAKLSADLQRLTGLLSSNEPGSVFDLIENVQNEIERQANAAYTNNINFERSTRMLSRQTATSAAAVIEERVVRATETSALAQQINQVVADLDTSLASGLLKLEASVDGIGAFASIAAKVRVTTAADYSEAAWILEASSDGLGGTTSVFGVYADAFYVVSATGDMEQAFVIESGVVKLNLARAGRITSADGTSMIIDFDDPEIYMEN